MHMHMYRDQYFEAAHMLLHQQSYSYMSLHHHPPLKPRGVGQPTAAAATADEPADQAAQPGGRSPTDPAAQQICGAQ